jgi:hypothetical protein
MVPKADDEYHFYAATKVRARLPGPAWTARLGPLLRNQGSGLEADCLPRLQDYQLSGLHGPDVLLVEQTVLA